MELRTVAGLRLVLFAPSELGVYAKPVSGGFAPVSPGTVLRDSGAQAAINGNMFDTCAGQDLPSDNAGHYRQSVCDIPEYMVRDGSLSAPGIYPTRGATISVVDGAAVVMRGANAPSNAKVAVQGYPTLVLEGQRQDTAHAGSNVERVYRSMLARMNNGQLAFIAGVGTMDSIGDAMVAAGVRDAIYLDGGGSTWLQTTEGGSYGASERRPIPSWLIVRSSSWGLGTWLAAGAAVATGLWVLFWSGPGVRWNPIGITDFDYFRTSGLHRHDSSWPERYVVNKLGLGWIVCGLCGEKYRVWMTLDSTWQRLPSHLHDRSLCVRCFRKHATAE